MIITWGGFVDVRLSQFHKKIISPSIMLHTLSSGLVCKNFEPTSKKRGYRFDTRAGNVEIARYSRRILYYGNKYKKS